MVRQKYEKGEMINLDELKYFDIYDLRHKFKNIDKLFLNQKN